MPELEQRLARRAAQQLYRTRLVTTSPQGPEIAIEGQRLLSFCCNDYLGLANHPDVIAALKAGVDRYGVGAGASHLISGHSESHHALEAELARFVGAERALLFSTGYMANLGVVTALTPRRGTVFEDRLNHASLIDAARLARVTVKRYPHAAADRLGALMCGAGGASLVTTDGVFSMDGDLAPLPALLELAHRHRVRLLIDDAHGFGVLGANGRGSLEHWRIPLRSPVILMATLGKAFGTFGAFVAGDGTMIEALIQEARTYIYTTALPPALAEAARASLKIVREESWRRERLQSLVRRFRRGAAELGFELPPSETPIQPLILGDNEKTVEASRALRRAGILVPAIRPPTVPAGSARLRITFSAAHHPKHVDRLLDALATIGVRA